MGLDGGLRLRVSSPRAGAGGERTEGRAPEEGAGPPGLWAPGERRRGGRGEDGGGGGGRAGRDLPPAGLQWPVQRVPSGFTGRRENCSHCVRHCAVRPSRAGAATSPPVQPAAERWELRAGYETQLVRVLS